MLKPLKDKYIVEPVSIYGKTSSGIYTAGGKKDIPVKAVVVSGDGDAAPGDTVYIKKYSWKEFRYDEKDLLCIKDQDILAIERAGEIRAPAGSIIVKLNYDVKDGRIVVPEKYRAVRSGIRAEVVAVHADLPYRIYPGDNIVILRMTDGTHEGREIDTDQGKMWSVYEKWVEGIYE